MNYVAVDFLNWRPDQDGQLGHDGLYLATNVLHSEGGWVHAKAHTAGALTNASIMGLNTLSALRVREFGGTDVNFAPVAISGASTTTAALTVGWYKSGGIGGNVPHTSVTFGTLSSLTTPWIEVASVAELGNNYVISAVGGASLLSGGSTVLSINGTVTYSITSLNTGPRINSTTFTGSGTTGMPDSSVVGTIAQFVFCGKYALSTDDFLTVQWCAIGDPTDWPTPGTTDAKTKQAGQQVFPGAYGKITGIVGNDFYGYIFQERAIHKVTYVGGDVVFNFDTIIDDLGCINYDRFTKVDEVVYFESQRGYHSITNDVITHIGFGKVDDSYTPTTEINSDCARVVSNAADKMVFFQNQKLAYNYATDQWSFPGSYPTYAAYYNGTNAGDQFGAMISIGAAKQSTYSTNVFLGDGSFLNANMQTTLFRPNPDGRTYVDSIRVNRSGGTGSSIQSASLLFTDDAMTDITLGNAASGSAENSRTKKIHFRGATTPAVGRYVSAAVNIAYTQTSATESAIRGLDVWFAPSGGD